MVAEHLFEELELGGCGKDEEEEGGEECGELHFGRLECWFGGVDQLSVVL